MYLEPYYNNNYNNNNNNIYGGIIGNKSNTDILPKLYKLHYFNNSLHFKDHLTYLNTLVNDNIPLGVIITDRVFSNNKYKTQLVTKLTNYINQHQPLVENATVKFICLNKCFQFMTSFYLISLPVAKKILDTLPKTLTDNDKLDILPDDIYKLYGNLTSVYWEGKHFITKTDTLQLNAPSNMKQVNTANIPIDLVYTWVNHDCNKWRTTMENYMGSDHFRLNRNIYNGEFMDLNRYRNRNELQYSLRSIELYMPWVRNIYIVTDDQIPEWLNRDHPKIKMVYHKDLLDKQHRPTFNSLSLESYLHRIPGISEVYIYFNDDFFVNKPVNKDTFINQEGQLLLYAQENPHIDRCDYFKEVVKTLPHNNTNTELQRELDIFIESCYKLFKVTPKGKASCHESGHYSQWKNVNKLLDRLFTIEDRKFVSHAPYPQKCSTGKKLEGIFAEQYNNTRNSRFRSTNCIGTTNSLYPYYNYYTNQAKIIDDHQVTQTLYFQNNPLINDVQFRALQQFKPTFFVIQDSTTAKSKTLDRQLHKLLNKMYPKKCGYEN